MPYNPHNVDICVTCVSDKPPQLPLREELPSLGIEVIYKAQGVGAKAAHDESKRAYRSLRRNKQQQQQQQQQQQEKKNEITTTKSYNKPSEGIPDFISTSKEDPPEERSDSASGGSPNTSNDDAGCNSGDSDNEEEDVDVVDDEDNADVVYTPKALSYSTYQRSLQLQMSKETSAEEANSLDTDSTMESEANENEPSDTKNKIPSSRFQLFGKNATKNNGDTSKPPTTVEIPATPTSKEELALREAFKAFSTVNNNQRNQNDASNLFLLSATTTKAKGAETKQETASKVAGAGGERKFSGQAKADNFPDLLEDSDDGTDNEDIVTDTDRESEEESEKESERESVPGKGRSSENTPKQQHVSQSNFGFSPRNGNIKVKLFSRGLNITEMYDLTELSDDEGDLVDSPSLDKDPFTTAPSVGGSHHGYDVNESTLFSSAKSDDPKNTVPVPEAHDGYGNLVLDLSYVYEEDGPGSPLVYSPTPDMDDVDSPSSRTDRYPISPSLSPSSQRVHFDIKKKNSNRLGFSDMTNTSTMDEGREDYNVLASPEMSVSNGREKYTSPTETTRFGYGTKSLFDDVSFHDPSRLRDVSSRDSNRSLSMLKIATPYHPTADHPTDEVYASIPTPREAEIPKDESFDPPSRNGQSQQQAKERRSESPSYPWLEATVSSYPSPRRAPSPRLIPAIKKNASRESDTHAKLSRVSFSQDIEERFFDEDDDDYLYKEAMADVKSSLAAIVHEERDFNEPLPSALSREADEAFRSMAEKLGMSDDGFRSPELMLVEALSYGDPIPFDFEDTLKRNPDLAVERLPDIDSYALHAACVRRFPERFGAEQRCRVKDLVDDVTLHQKLIGALVAANPSACRRVDENGDLPVHIMARRLMEWEARWYQKVYENSKREESEEENGKGITRLYQSMSECINSLLSPVAQDPSLCLQSGSVGLLLPLHIAAIFTVSYDTLRDLLEAYPDAASVKCDLSDIRTFIPDRSIPLELHDRLSTDFPKWEIQRIHSGGREELTQANLDKTYGTKGGMRRSDLMYAFAPGTLPYRKENDRIRRMETRIRSEILDNESTGLYSLSVAAQTFWIWMCQFENGQDEVDEYSDSIRRIIYSLSVRAIRFLASLPTSSGKPIFDRATAKCTDAILERLNKRADSEIPVPIGSLFTGFNSTERSFLLRQFDEDMANRFCLQGRGFVGPLCRTLFNITEGAFPSSFVVLPYKLVKDNEGRLGLESAKAAKVAMKFAEFLLILTSPTCILQALDRKVSRFLGQGLVDEFNDEGVASHSSLKDLLNQFLALYDSGPAYFYFLDEYKGTPIVSENNSIYPFVVSDAADVVRKVFPLMLTGMILMRGEKAIPILAETLLDKNVKLIQPHWIKAGKDVVGYMFSTKTEWTRSLMHDLYPLRDRMLEFVQRGHTEATDEDGLVRGGGLASEWVVETSLIRMVVEMHDPQHTFNGLQPRRNGIQVMWTADPEFLSPNSNEYLMQIDFKSIDELNSLSLSHKEALAAEKRLKNGDSVTGASATGDNNTMGRRSGYEELFEDLALSTTSGTVSDGGKIDRSGDDTDDGGDLSTNDHKSKARVTVNPTTSSYQQQSIITSRYSSLAASHTKSVLDFDDSLDLDDVLKLRIQLDEQEAKLEFLREKIDDLEDAERDLIYQEDKITVMIDEILHQRDNVVKSPSKSGLSKARALLLRICDLEERVLCREVEVGQLKNDISCFELESSIRRESLNVDQFFGDSELDVLDDGTINSNSSGSVASSMRSS